MSSIPHLKVPLTLAASGFAQVGQDSPEEVDQCITAILRTPAGTRVDVPAFGRPDTTFAQLGPQTSAQVYLEAVELWEPRASVDATVSIENELERIEVEETE